MRLNKIKYIKSLPNIKLIIGNGFDIHCGLHTKYSHYFWYFKELYDPIIEWYSKIESKFNGGSISKADIDSMPKNDTLNIWDYFFAIYFVIRKQKERKWCDVERTISASLFLMYPEPKDEIEITKNLSSEYQSPVNWDKAYKSYINKKETITDCNDVMAEILCLFEFDKNKYYYFLLEQLKMFEQRFGVFIGEQVGKEVTTGWEGTFTFSSKYQEAIRQTIAEIADEGHIRSIDTFNFSYFANKDLEAITRHINGNCMNPVFGVDSEYLPSENGFIFTKTYRRLELNMLSDDYYKDNSFDNLFIYGHSLNKADYNYFFPILDKLKIADSLCDSKIVLCYSEEQSDEDIEKMKNDFCTLVNAYANYSKISPSRLLDSLTAQGRILFHMIPAIRKNSIMMSRTSFDLPWKDFKE